MRSLSTLLPAALIVVSLVGCTNDADTPPASSSTPPVNHDRATTGGQPVPSSTDAPGQQRDGTIRNADTVDQKKVDAMDRTDTRTAKNSTVTGEDRKAADDLDNDVNNDVDADPIPAADNTGTNTRDRDDMRLTPMDQGSSESDIAITQAIRKAVVDGDLSINAQNVKIITNNGVVTLRGPVETAAERAAIEMAAQRTVGVTRVDNQLEIAER